jgi:hypothetical protein
VIDLPQPGRQSQPRRPDLSPHGAEPLAAESRSTELGWSPTDELATLEVVWESLCQDAASPVTSLQLPTIAPTTQARAGGQRPLRQRNRLVEDQGRLAS